jgi:HAD superfamily hydrolase (TIGR01549 family)
VFDTLLYRLNPNNGAILINPDDMFYLIQEHHNKNGFGDARITAETKAREYKYGAKNKTMHHEITMHDIYSLIPQQFQDMQMQEICWELQNIRANFPMTDLLKQIKNSGKQIIITSDMYLGSDIIGKMLSNVNILPDDYVKLYVSSHIGKTKASGELYKHVIKDTGVQPNKILHIGDNEKSDFNIAKQNGLNAILYRNGMLQAYK